MTKKHFIALADMIKWGYPSSWTEFQLDQLASFCGTQNPRFNRERWLGYIAGTNGPNGEKVK